MSATITVENVVAKKVKGGKFAVLDRNTTEILIGNLTKADAESKAEKITAILQDGNTIEEAVQLVTVESEITEQELAKLAAIEEEAGATTEDFATTLCGCGCGEKPESKNARFLPGHDGRLKGQLLKVWRGKDAEAAKDAEAQMRKLGWGDFLAPTKAELRREEVRTALIARGAAVQVRPVDGENNAQLLRRITQGEAQVRKARAKAEKDAAKAEKDAS